MTFNEFLTLKEKYKQASDLQEQINHTKREIAILESLTDESIKNCFYQKVFPFLTINDEEYKIQELFCKKIISYAVEYRKQQLKRLQKDFDKL